MNELEEKGEGQIPQGGGGSKKRKRRREIPRDEFRCIGRLPTGRRCEAARLRHSNYCVFHDPEMVERRIQLMEKVPYEHPDEVQRLLAEAAQAVMRKRLSPKAGNTLGYLASLLVQNLERVEKEKENLKSAQFYAEMQAGVDEFMVERAERQQQQREAQEAERGD